MPASITSYVPQCAPRRRGAQGARVWLAWAGVVACGLFLLALIYGAPLASSRGSNLTAAAMYGVFNLFCHQLPERSFHLAGHPLAVCARCLGIYAGFAAAALLFPLVHSLELAKAPARVWLVAALAPLALDFSLDFLGIRQNTHYSRLATGLLLGATAACYVIPGIVELVLRGGRAGSAKASEESRTKASEERGSIEYLSSGERKGV